MEGDHANSTKLAAKRRNEKRRLTANFVNAMSISVGVLTFVTPAFNVDRTFSVSGAIACLALHMLARYIVGAIETE